MPNVLFFCFCLNKAKTSVLPSFETRTIVPICAKLNKKFFQPNEKSGVNITLWCVLTVGIITIEFYSEKYSKYRRPLFIEFDFLSRFKLETITSDGKMYWGSQYIIYFGSFAE
uniref:Uncharacterized protein n=1 Tax=Cacopsylla melanoneura TaxID=428564 RepID=A0A8D8SCU1_9HEMI